jgi:hypothetical protein
MKIAAQQALTTQRRCAWLICSNSALPDDSGIVVLAFSFRVTFALYDVRERPRDSVTAKISRSAPRPGKTIAQNRIVGD